MAIGSHTFWILVQVSTRKAITAPNDKRRAMMFASEDAAYHARGKLNLPADEVVLVVEVPA